MRIGIDLGGTKIEALALDASGQELWRKRVDTPQGDYPGTLQAIRDLVQACERCIGVQATVGLGTPGAISPATGLLKNSNSVCLNGRPFRQDLEALLGRSVRMANDANCFALSEATDGAGAGKPVVFGVILGTGVGGGVVVHGRVLTGPNAIAGEWGHNPMPAPRDDERPGPACYCGRLGCIETFLCGPALAQQYRLSAGEPASAAEVVARAAHGEAQAEAVLTRYEERLARALGHVINLLDPDVIVLGGGMSKVSRLYENVPRLWSAYVFSDCVDTVLASPQHGDASGVRGAAWLWNEG